MTATAHIFALITGADPKARTITVEVGRSRSAFDAVEGGREAVLNALKALVGEPVVEMVTGSPPVGEVLSVEEVGKPIRLIATITAPRTWAKLDHKVFKGARVQLFGVERGKYAGNLMLADVPAPDDMVVRCAGATNRGYEVCLTVDEAQATVRELRRLVHDAAAVVAESEAFHTRPWSERSPVSWH